MEWLRQRYDNGEDVDLVKEADVPSAISLLRFFLQELPEPVIPGSLHIHLMQLSQGKNCFWWRYLFLRNKATIKFVRVFVCVLEFITWLIRVSCGALLMNQPQKVAVPVSMLFDITIHRSSVHLSLLVRTPFQALGFVFLNKSHGSDLLLSLCWYHFFRAGFTSRLGSAEPWDHVQQCEAASAWFWSFKHWLVIWVTGEQRLSADAFPTRHWIVFCRKQYLKASVQRSVLKPEVLLYVFVVCRVRNWSGYQWMKSH